MNKEINQIAAGLQKLGVKKGDTVVLVAFGAGLTWGATTLRW